MAFKDNPAGPFRRGDAPKDQKFAARVEEIEAESKKKLDELFNSLMQRAFTGELVA